jgi:hypothetical protein
VELIFTGHLHSHLHGVCLPSGSDLSPSNLHDQMLFPKSKRVSSRFSTLVKCDFCPLGSFHNTTF